MLFWIASKTAQEAPKRLQDPPKSAQRGPKKHQVAPGGPKRTQKAFKMRSKESKIGREKGSEEHPETNMKSLKICNRLNENDQF